MLTCVIRPEIDPTKTAEFTEYARASGQASLRNGSDLIGHDAPREGSSTLALEFCNIESLAACEASPARLAQDPIRRANDAFARREKFPRREDRTCPRLVSAPQEAAS